MPVDAPSRAGRKLEEAFEWVGRAPEAGDVCVDLGAAPGGWTAVLLARRARVIAVDPAKLAENLRQKKGVAHVQASAFEFTPTEPVDWLFCDMAWRPMEVAALLAKWGTAQARDDAGGEPEVADEAAGAVRGEGEGGGGGGRVAGCTDAAALSR
jgi:23S rRNA C2498 (ribose-2'-O)-methylase RlmM